MRFYFDTTIAAPATGSGGAISIIRVSGPDTFVLCDKLFRPVDKTLSIGTAAGFSILYGEIVENGKTIDEVLVTVFRAPHSYSGEDSVEISCHASPYIQQKIMELLVNAGVKAAAPGEFTQRAFLNGRIDLSQAEAVADVISSQSEASHRLAMHQLRGGFSGDIRKLRNELLNFASLVELELDFSEEDVEFADRSSLRRTVESVKKYTDNLASSFRLGNAIKNGLPVAIVGKPNAGKSTLLNSILNDDRAIVSDIPGTTRDVIEDTIIIDGILYRFIDTAGLRETADIIENLGIRKTYQKIGQAMVIMLVTEASDGAGIILQSARSIREQIKGEDKKLIIVVNKSDLEGEKELAAIEALLKKESADNFIMMSATNREDITRLNNILGTVTGIRLLDDTSMIVTNIRHWEALTRSSESLARVIEGIEGDIPQDLVAMDLRQAIHFLGEIIGEITADDILANIFKNFCIGK